MRGRTEVIDSGGVRRGLDEVNEPYNTPHVADLPKLPAVDQ